MHKIGRSWLDANERTMLENRSQLSERAAMAARRLFVGPEGESAIAKYEAKDTALDALCEQLDLLVGDNPQEAWEALNSLRIRYEFRHRLPGGFLKEEPDERKAAA